MPEIFSRWLRQLSEFWKSLEKSQKTRLYITSAIVVAAITIGIVMLTRPSRIILVSNADQKQVGEMSTILNENKIWNSLDNGGSSIVINSKDNNKAQVLLAQEGYPKGGMTFEDAISMIGISTTESDKKHIWKQQQISDIEAKLMMLDNIELATVSLALPEKTIFVTEDQKKLKPTAYVMVKPKEPLTPEQVKGIVMIVSRSVEGLDPKDITVVDNNSNILNSETSEDSVNIANSQEEIRLKREKDLQNKVREYFNVGQFENFDTFRVVANVILDFDKEKSQSKTLANPQGMDSGALISSDILKEKLENGTVNGVPGTDTNPGNANSPSYQVGNGENSSYNKQHDIKNFGYNETLNDREKAVGKLIPDESSLAISLWYGKKVTSDTGLTDDFINQVKQAASSATGIPLTNISVNKYKLAAPEVVKKSTSEIVREMISDYGFFAVMLLLIIGLLIMAIPRKKRTEQAPIPQLQAAAAGGPRFTVPEPSGELLPEIELEERSEIKKQLEKFVKQKPDAVAQLLRNWLSDEWDS